MAAWLAHRRVRPNWISLASVGFAALAGLGLLLSRGGTTPGRVAALVGAAACIQLRLLCNLLDGMVAIEGGARTPAGEVFNDFPDRCADTLILVTAGYAISGVAWARDLGWMAALLAVLTAYVRVLGGALGLPQDFGGPMAKPHRMAVMTGACLVAAGEAWVGAGGVALLSALLVVALGSAVTVWRRTARIVRGLGGG
jgi:phosphatidylglycerophosphate synthase